MKATRDVLLLRMASFLTRTTGPVSPPGAALALSPSADFPVFGVSLLLFRSSMKYWLQGSGIQDIAYRQKQKEEARPRGNTRYMGRTETKKSNENTI